MRPSRTGVLAVVLGVGLFIVSGVSVSPATDTEYAISDVERTDATGLDTVQYIELPPAGQQAFRAGLDGRDPVGLSPGRDERSIQRLRANQAVVYEGAVYGYDLSHVDGSQAGVVRALLVTAGAALTGIGLSMRIRNQLRPLTTVTAILTGSIVLMAFGGLTFYEEVIQSGSGAGLVFGTALPASFVAVVTGTAVRRGDTTGAGISGGLAVAVVLVSVFVGQGSPFTLAFLPLLSVPWFLLGYLLSQPESDSTASIDGLRGP